MTTLYLAWQDYKGQQWFPVGRLDADESVQPTAYEFAYISGAEEAREQAQFRPDPWFPRNSRNAIGLTTCFRCFGTG